MILGIVVLLIFLLLFYLARKEQGSCFEKMAMFLHKRKFVRKLLEVGSIEVNEEIRRLYPGQSFAYQKTEYELKKIKMILLIVFAGSMFGLVFDIKNRCKVEIRSDMTVIKGKVGENTKEVTVKYKIEDLQEEMVLTIPARVYSREEIEENLPKFWEELERKILADNPSLSEVTGNLCFADSLASYPFEITYYVSDLELFDMQGNLNKKIEKKENTRIEVTIAYEDMEWNKELMVCVLPGELTKQEILQEQVNDKYLEEVEKSKYSEQITLPTEINGREITWSNICRDHSGLFMGAICIISVLIYFAMDRDLTGKREERQARMRESYPALVQKFTLYLGAGMTVRGAFLKLSEEYLKKREEKKKIAVYEEVLYSMHQLQAGTNESKVYEELGERIGLKEYNRFCSLLIQNLKKGNHALLERLNQECEQTLLESMNARKKKGEEAETKLLFPMVMILGIIMVMIMYPALISMGVT